MTDTRVPNRPSVVRTAVLLFGPPLIVTLCYWASLGRSSDGNLAPRLARSAAGAAAEPPVDWLAADLPTACRLRAAWLAERLGDQFALLVRPPFVLAGNCPPKRLEELFSSVVEPFVRAFAVQFDARLPDEPVVLLVFKDNASYRRWAERLDQDDRRGYTGYYQREARRVLADVSAGTGPLTHELTHALTHFDFPPLPEWFDEGLGALYESPQFRSDGLAVFGTDNWRRYYVLYALRTGRLRPLEALLQSGRIRPDHQAVDYAHARYFCLFLQSTGRLVPFYRRWRDAYERDPNGVQTLRQLFDGASLTQVDNQFRHWLLLKTGCARQRPFPSASVGR